MALSLGDAFLNFTAGAVERNNKIRDENVALALEDFKANKDLYQKIALDRYSKDSARYEKELDKMDSLKSVHSFISKNNLDRESAASLVLSSSMPGFANLDKKDQRRLILKTAASFNTTYNDVPDGPAGSETKKVESGFEIVPEQIKLTAPNMKDYLQDPSFWTELQNEIKTGTSGPLTNQVLKLLKKDNLGEAAKEKLNNLEQKDGSEIKVAGQVESILSNNTSQISGIETGSVYAYGDGDWASLPESLQKAWTDYVLSDPDGNQRKEIGEIFNSLELKEIKKAIIQYQNGEAIVRPGGTSLFSEAQDLYKGIAEDILNSIMKTGGANAGNTSYFTNKLVRKIYKQEFYDRLIKVNDNDMKGMYLIPTEVMGYGMKLSDYKKPNGTSVTEQDIIAVIKNSNVEGSLGENTIAIHQQVYKYLSTLKNDKITSTESGSNTTGSNTTGSNTTGSNTTGASFSTVSSTVSTIKAILNSEDAKKDGVTISQIIEDVNKDGNNYDVKAIELLVNLESPPNKWNRTGSVGKKSNPAYEAWVESGQLDAWKNAVEYLKSIEPEARTSSAQKVPNKDWTQWKINYGSYIKEYEKFLKIK